MTEPRRRGKAKTPRRPLFGPEKMRAAFMAGQGKSGEEIADYLGGTTGPKIRAILRKAGVTMRRKTGADDLFTLRCHRKDVKALFEAADARDMEANDLLLILLRDALKHPAFIDNVLEEHDREAAE